MGPCSIGNGGCSPMAVCLATSGTVQCFCRPGYRGTGVGPMGCLPGSSQGPSPPDEDTGVVVSPCIRDRSIHLPETHFQFQSCTDFISH